MVLALFVPVLMFALLMGLDVFEERLFGARPSPPSPSPDPETAEDATPVIPEQPPLRPE
ncbi:hypothetical protein [Streptomyces incarnatus]|uniref:hypothetical protein n=1 Tax=Streptomyces incarnatus TaxID=665007 RepID=UPI000A5B7B47|nr:hypothetical protein [Streptomyces incarnatus]